MSPSSDSSICYICHDKRRTATTDASITRTGPHTHSRTLKQTLIRALTHGNPDDETGEFRMASGVCVVSLNSRYDGGLEAVGDRAAGDDVRICRRCLGLLKDFDHHEQMAARKAEEIRRFIMRQSEVEEEEEEEPRVSSKNPPPQDSVKRTMARTHDERQGIMAAFRAMRKAGVREAKGKGSKRKKDTETSDGIGRKDEEEEVEIVKEEEEEEEEEEDTRHQEMGSARQSERIQRRREDGLVVRWGDALYENEDDMKLLEDEEDFFDYSPSTHVRDRPQRRRGRGRKFTRIARPPVLAQKLDDDMEYKFQCPFCFRYYTPMSSRIHNCTSYKNQLRCQDCNIFFTSYIRLEKHLEVVHLKQRQLTCEMDGCGFTCIADPTLTIHKHFHVLESFTGEPATKNTDGTRKNDTDTKRREVTQGGVTPEEVTIEDEEKGVVSSPEIADRVSFLIDEKSFLSDGNPLNITMDRIPKDAEDGCKVLRFQGSDRGQDKSPTLNPRVEIGSLSPGKSERKSPKPQNLVLQCPICDMTLVSTRSYQEHIRDIHNLRVTTKITGEESVSREPPKGQGSESLMRIVKYYNVKKNSNVILGMME